jgi:phage minor structural protein
MIYLFNQTEELIDVIDEASLADFTHTIELNQFDRASFEIPVDYKPNIIKEAQFFGFQSRDRAFCLFRISEKSYDIGLTIQGIDRAESDLHSFIIEDKRPGGNASDVLREILKGTGYQLGNVDGLTINGNMSFYYISVRQALVKLIESYVCEFKVRYTFVENKIIGRYIDLNQRFGRKTGHQFEYGSNILNVTYEESSDEVVTALIGRGKGEQSTDDSGEATGGYGRRIQFKDVVWSVSKGDPVDKPAGQNYVANETARNIYGLHQNGEIKHRFGVYTNEDIEDPVELLKATYKELQRLSVPIVTFKANLLDLANAIEQDVWIGDSVGIVRDQIGIAFETRIHKLIIDKLDDNRSVVELGDYQTLQAKDRSSRQQAIKDAVSGFSEGLIEEAIANEVERRNKEFDEKIRVNKLEFDNELQRAKERAEEVKRQISSEIDKKFQSFDNASIQEAKRKAEEALRSAGASNSLAQEAKRISDQAKSEIDNLRTSSQTAVEQIEAFKTQYGTKLNEVKNTADGLFTKMGAVETYINKDGQRQESLQRYARDESARQVSAVREQISRDYVGKSTYQEDVRGLERRFSAISTQTDNDIATKIAQYKQTVDGQFASITSQIAGKVNQTDFQRVRETSRLYERIIGSSENDISNKIARMALTNQLFQVEVAKSLGSDNNLIVRSKSMDRHTLVNEGNTKRVFVNDSVFTIRCTGNSEYTFAGFTLPLYIDRMAKGETYTLNFKYRIMGRLDHNFTVVAKNHGTNETAIASDVATSLTAVSSSWQEFNETYTISRDFEFGNSELYPLYFYLAKNGWIEIKEVMLVRANQTNGYKASQLDDMSEAVRTVQSQLAGSWSVQNLTSAGALVSQINATNNQILIEAEKIRLKGKTLLDELTAIQGYFKRLFVGEGAFAKLNAEIIGSKTITADKLIMDQAMARMFVSSNIFTDMLAAKEAFINKLRSVVVTATLLEGYKGKIGGFQIGTHDNDPSSFWLTGLDQFKVGMSNGRGRQFQTAFWANWGNDWGKPGPLSWYVTLEGKMFCRNDVAFHRVVDFSNTSIINFYGSNNFHKNIEMKGGSEIYGTGRSPRENGKNAVVWWSQVGDGTVKYWIDKVSDRRLKRDIIDTDVNAINKINQLKMVAFDFIKTGKHEEIGLIAQDVEAVIPQAISQNPENPDGYLHIDYTAFVPYLIKAIQELNQKLEEIA